MIVHGFKYNSINSTPEKIIGNVFFINVKKHVAEIPDDAN